MNKKGQKEGVCMEHGSGWRGRAEFDKHSYAKSGGRHCHVIHMISINKSLAINKHGSAFDCHFCIIHCHSPLEILV